MEPKGQLKSLANSFELEKGPLTRNIPGECAPVRTRLSRDFGRYFEHQTLAAVIQNNCLVFILSPGNRFSVPCRCSQRSTKSKKLVMKK